MCVGGGERGGMCWTIGKFANFSVSHHMQKKVYVYNIKYNIPSIWSSSGSLYMRVVAGWLTGWCMVGDNAKIISFAIGNSQQHTKLDKIIGRLRLGGATYNIV